MQRLHCIVLVFAVFQAALCVNADSPSPDEFPFWPTSVPFTPKRPFQTCSPTDLATPHGAATWSPQFTSCVYTLAYFDTCADDACVDAFDDSTSKALNCSYDGKIGTAKEVENNRFQRCVAARRVESDRYIPELTPNAPKCSSEKLAAWNANYSKSQDYNSCLKALTTATSASARTCSEYCRRVFHDAVSDADECLFSDKAGNVTHHEWLKYLLVWCIQARGETIRADPLLYVKGTSSPVPTTPKPTTKAPTTAPPVESSSGSNMDTPKPTKKPRPTTSAPNSSASQDVDASDANGSSTDLGSSSIGVQTRPPVVKPPVPQQPSFPRTQNTATSLSMSLGVLAVTLGLVYHI